MIEIHPVLKKLNVKDQSKPVLIMNAPLEYNEIIEAFEAEVHTEVKESRYSFIQVFGKNNKDIEELAKRVEPYLLEDGLFWLCYPKKSSKTYKGFDSSRDTVAMLLTDEGYQPVRQVAIDDDWSALRFRKAENIKTMANKKK